MESRILFVKQFLATLFCENIRTIPINDLNFKNGIENMSQYFYAHKERFGPYVNKIDLLFLKYSTRGDYNQFAKVIESFNGRIVSLENPHYVKANIRLEKPYADELVKNHRLGIEENTMYEIVQCFRHGAGLE